MKLEWKSFCREKTFQVWNFKICFCFMWVKNNKINSFYSFFSCNFFIFLFSTVKKRFRILFMMLWCYGQFRVQHFLMFYVQNAKITAEAPAQLVRCIVGNLSLLIKHMIWGTFVFLRLLIQTLIVPVKFLMMRVQERKLSVPQIKNKNTFLP